MRGYMFILCEARFFSLFCCGSELDGAESAAAAKPLRIVVYSFIFTP